MKRLLLDILFVTVVLTPGISQPNNPVANPDAIVFAGNARFTLLTPQLIRMEWSASGRFEDAASLVFINRKLEAPRFTTELKDGWRIIQTEKLTVRYLEGSGRFTADNFDVTFTLNGSRVLWRPGMEDKGNLRGTTRTLDGVEGATSLEPGILSHDGWTVVDDTDRPLFDKSDWPWVTPRPEGDRQDLYFFGYGHDYKRALFDFIRVAGRIPIPPRFAFGLWWSRYWAYTDQEFKDLVEEFETYDVPLDVLVIDMDWHQTFNLRWAADKRDQAGQQLGWTGYTWDRNFFPDPPAFLGWCESKGLKTPLNLHPASGIQPHEGAYPAIARAMGIVPETRRYVPFDIVDKKFAQNYLSIVLRPLEEQGVDFWWLDWQQWGSTKIPGVSPTWWLNYVFFTDMERRAKSRPLIFHRWGGLGNHRYQIGFSGDAISVWPSLAFQPYFTATAANVGFGYWSHDIGGHMPGPVSPELYTRWIQWGTFSPILRTHTTKNPLAERRIWAYPPEYFRIMRNAVLLRYSLIPYVYSAARHAYDTGISICHPMYYDHPEAPEAYEFKDQYMFGNDMIVAPVTLPLDTSSMLSEKKVWVPPGEWVEWFTGNVLRGPAVVTRWFALDEIPVYVRGGAIIPMQPKMRRAEEKPVDLWILTIFPGATGQTEVYEDAGNSIEYTTGRYGSIRVKHSESDKGQIRDVEIIPRIHEGVGYQWPTKRRSYEIRLPGSWPPEKVLSNGSELPYRQNRGPGSWWYDGQELTTVISTPEFGANTSVNIRMQTSSAFVGADTLLSGFRGKLARLQRVMPLINNTWPKEWSPDELLRAAQTGNRIGLSPTRAYAELEALGKEYRKALEAVGQLSIDSTLMRSVEAHLTTGLR